MKRGKRLTREQKEIAYSHGLDVDKWMLNRKTDFYLYLVSKDGKERRTIGNFKLRKEKPLCR